MWASLRRRDLDAGTRSARGDADRRRSVRVGQLSSQHRVALLDEILPPYNRNLVPPIPIDITVGLEHRIEAMLVERHLVPRMPKESAAADCAGSCAAHRPDHH